MRPFPAAPGLTGNYVPLLIEGNINDCVIEGDVPPTLRGSYYRNGPNPQYPPRGTYANWYDGDGMVHAWHFDDGRVSYVNRWTRTERFLAERKAGRALYPTLYSPGSGDPSVQGKSLNAANDTILVHHGRVFSTWETGLPHELDPISLETKGPYDFAGGIPHDVMVHPKIDGRTGELHLFGRTRPHPEAGDSVYHVVDRDGRVVHSTRIKTPYDSMTHDMFLTEDYVVLSVMPGVYDRRRLAEGKPYLAWENHRSSFLGVLERFGRGEDIVWIEFAGCWGSHTMNAYQQGDELLCDTARYPRAMLFPNPDGTWPDLKTMTLPSVYRWRVDLKARSVKEERFDGSLGEMPSMDLRHRAHPYRHGYSAGWAKPGGNFDCVHHYDWKSGQRESYVPGDGCFVGEPAFAPRTPDSPEGDGYILTTVFRRDENRSDLVVLDAQRLANGPIATVKMPHRVPGGLHGAWRQR
ncbi:MAG: carotenoid oxygenase family protein [Alphaproteobacteria bacterium]|nr:carotenoid oxygenase family protein [Alphaproteobacteria bacterium]